PSAAQHASINETSTSVALNYKDPLNDPHPLPKPIKADEVFKAALSLKIGKSPGVDGISGDLIRQSETSQKWIYEICSRCFDAEKQPSEWLKSKVTLIKKPRKPAQEIGSYRTVMAQVAAAKIYSTVIFRRINDHLDKHIHHSQCGFRKSRSAAEVIHATQLLRDASIAHNRPLCLLMADWQKAFDKLDRGFMMSCLQQTGLHPKYLRIIEQSYADAIASITLHDETGEVRLESGVKQGDIW
ncbi:hypothetical protein FOZ62_016584, partial [Perkinsus olseni]